MGVCNCSMFCCTLLYVSSSFTIILMGKRELVALLNLSSWCLVIVVWLFLAVPWVCLQFVIAVFPDHTHLLYLLYCKLSKRGYIRVQQDKGIDVIKYAYSTGYFVLHDFLSTFMIIFFMLVDTLFIQCALKCKNVQHR